MWFPNPLQAPLSPDGVPRRVLTLPSGTFLSTQTDLVVASSGAPWDRAPSPAAFASRLRCPDLAAGVCTASAGFAPAPA